MEGFLRFTVLIVKLNFTPEEITTSYLFTAWPTLVLAVVLLHCKSQYNQRLLFVLVPFSGHTLSACGHSHLRVRDRASGDEISQPKQNQRLYTASRPQTELAFYLQCVLP
jgi:hypothetical protein